MAKPPPHRKHLALARWVYARYRARIASGVVKYGDFDPKTDKRNMGKEGLEELLDFCSYLEFGEAMRPDLSRFIQEMRADAFLLIGKARKWEEMMRTPAREGDA